MNERYTKGRNFEYQIKKIFEKKGFKVMRASGSHGLFDLIAFKKNGSEIETIFIQAKSYKKSSKSNARKILEDILKKMNILPQEERFFHSKIGRKINVFYYIFNPYTVFAVFIK
jgi:predicted RNA binding protein YcfA (HicA-like mRNA interferase family)